ncbi:MAG: phospholipase D family protein, partial [Xanthomonadales bacterium]|nr:phospholipase D family protein [Xanthomonadales bacterium]
MPGFRFRLFVAILLASLLAGCAGGLQPIETPDEFTPPPSDAMQWQELEAVREGDWFYVLNVGSEAFDWRLRAIDSAVESIDFQTFIWDLDSAGHRVLGHLLTAAERGVRVRVLVDDSFILDADRQLLDIDRHENIELKVFNPYKRRSSDAALRQVLNAGEFYRLDHRMHNKVMVIDNRAAIIGGRNIAEEYFGYHEEHNFRDMELVLAGPLAQELSAGFDSYWNNDWSFPVAAVLEQRGALEMPTEVDLLSGLEHTDHAELTFAERLDAWKQLAATAHEGRAELLLDRPPEENPAEESQAPVQVGNRLIEAIDAAQEEVWLVSAYLIPTGAFEDAVDRAVSRGVRVRILTNSINSNNHLTAHSAYRRHVRHLVESGAEVHEVR